MVTPRYLTVLKRIVHIARAFKTVKELAEYIGCSTNMIHDMKRRNLLTQNLYPTHATKVLFTLPKIQQQIDFIKAYSFGNKSNIDCTPAELKTLKEYVVKNKISELKVLESLAWALFKKRLPDTLYKNLGGKL